MGEPISTITAAVGAGHALLKALWNLKKVYSRKLKNDELVREVETFRGNLDGDLGKLKRMRPRSNTALWAAGALEQELDRATEYVEKCHKRGFIRLIWSASSIQDKLKG